LIAGRRCFQDQDIFGCVFYVPAVAWRCVSAA
jgi:hypothetical protein